MSGLRAAVSSIKEGFGVGESGVTYGVSRGTIFGTIFGSHHIRHFAVELRYLDLLGSTTQILVPQLASENGDI